ncbi:GGDEF domain-containing protein [Candidatus Terasakiella magnetica]|uniref:diguanylate cyclase n=1 Tax=Candidatus Terasakiella magnetica TaxID=1867952 RepID=A0A1C3RKS9_9PROT|nr:GGDEF domain-containing protein [Candidatus Terasakiella magnetica]SCA57779.1 GGDEF domain-containing protein [Candidatus Terasakiella magnetica]
MEYTENIDQALEYANQAIAKMRDIGVPANPNNFTVWFHYYSGTYPDLKRTLDILLDNQQAFSETRNSEIFQKFFTLDQESAILHDTTARMEGELARIVTALDGAEDNYAMLDSDLRNFQEKLAQGDQANDMTAIVDSLNGRIGNVLEHNSALEDELKSSIKEIDELKEDLERMRREAMTDGLTGIANRKLFDLELRKSSMNAMANGEELALMMIDVDHFARFNEHHGHQVGDQVLKLVAVTIAECIKGQDTAARYGGDEFSVILPRTSLDNAMKLAENICKRVSSKNVINRATGERLGKITMSAGVATFEYGEPISQLLVRADHALQEAMRNGYNQVLTQVDLKDSVA